MSKLLAVLAGGAVIIAAGMSVLIVDTTQKAEVFPPAPLIENKVDKAVVLVIENKGFEQVKAGAPFINSMCEMYGCATNFYAVARPSRPNYAAMASGSTKGITSNSFKTVSGPTVMGNAWKAGRSGKVIMDGMFTDRCRTSNGGNKYVEKHNPWTAFKDEKALCEKYDFDLKYLASDVAAGKLANVEFIVPNQCNNAHDCSLKTADNWIKKKVELIQTGPDWKSGKLAIIITADEDNKKENNKIMTVVMHSSQDHNVVSARLDLYSLSGLLSEVGHSAKMNNAVTAPSMSEAFGLLIN